MTDLYMERYFTTSMAVFSFFLSGGSQVSPMIAGFLVSAKGWRWFFILCTILIALNLILMLSLLPETNYRCVLYKGETAQEADKKAAEMLKHEEKQVKTTIEERTPQLNEPYAGSYWKDLIQFKNRGMEEKGLLAWPRRCPSCRVRGGGR